MSEFETFVPDWANLLLLADIETLKDISDNFREEREEKPEIYY